MVIRFLCPNGHEIKCQDNMAGRAAKCPKCSVKFRIPSPNNEEEEPAPGAASPAATAGKEEQIEFLCPNGHRLHGPSGLQGKPGQCPECGSRFRIPVYGDVSDEEEAEQGLGVGALDDQAQAPIEQVDRLEESSDEEEPTYTLDLEEPEEEALPPPTLHPTAALMERLWQQKAGEVEVYLAGGEKIIPDRFVPRPWSQDRYGLFIVEEPEGTYTVSAVAWDDISRIVLRQIKDLPDDISQSGKR